MVYNATYTSDDASPIVIDLGLKIFVVGIGFASVIGLVLLWKFFRKNTKK